MFWRIFKEVLGAAGLVFVGWLAVSAVLSLEKPAPKPVAYFEPRMTHPIQCDATMSTRGAAEKWTKPKCYVNGGANK